MAHILTKFAKLWKPQDLAVDKINSKMMFSDNIDATESMFLKLLKRIDAQVNTVSALKAVDTSDVSLYTDGMMVFVKEKACIYYFDRNSVAAESSIIIAPTTGGGRWISLLDKNVLSSAVQGATIGGVQVSKSGTVLQLPAYPTKLPADGGTSTASNDGIKTLTHLKDGSVHTLSGLPPTVTQFVARFKATADFADGDTWFDGYTSTIQTGEPLTNGYFKNGGWVNSVVVDTVNKTLGFMAGSSKAKDIVELTGAIVNNPEVIVGSDIVSLTVLGETVDVGTGTKSPDNVHQLISSTPTEITVASKNLFNGQWELGLIDVDTGANIPNSSAIRTVGFIPVDSLLVYTISRHQSITNGKFRFYDSNLKYIGSSSPSVGTLSTKNPLTFTIPTNAKYVRFNLDGVTDLNYPLQLEIGSTATSYTPYSAKKYSLPAGLKLRSLPDGTREEYVYGQSRRLAEIDEETFTGTPQESWMMFPSQSTETTLLFQLSGMINTSMSNLCVCDRFEWGGAWSGTTECITIGGIDLDKVELRINKSRLATPDESGLKLWLQSNPITIHHRVKYPKLVTVGGV